MEEQKYLKQEEMYPNEDQDGSIRCVFYLDMDCMVREAFERSVISDKLAVVPKDSPFGVMTMIGPKMQRFMILAAYCGMCPYKSVKDLDANIAHKLMLGEKYGKDADSELQIVRFIPKP